MKKQTKSKLQTHGQTPKDPPRNYSHRTPILSAYFLYLEEERWKSVRDQSELPMQQIVQQAYTNWIQNLTKEQKDVYAEKAEQIKNESDAREYLKMLEQTYTIKKKINKVKQQPKPKNKK